MNCRNLYSCIPQKQSRNESNNAENYLINKFASKHILLESFSHSLFKSKPLYFQISNISLFSRDSMEGYDYLQEGLMNTTCYPNRKTRLTILLRLKKVFTKVSTSLTKLHLIQTHVICKHF